MGAAAEYPRGAYRDAYGFSPRDLRRMLEFCTYRDAPKVLYQPMSIGWTQIVYSGSWPVLMAEAGTPAKIAANAHQKIVLDFTDDICYTEANPFIGTNLMAEFVMECPGNAAGPGSPRNGTDWKIHHFNGCQPEHATLERQGRPLNERRLHERYPFHGKALLHLKVGDEILRIRYPCEIVDISEGGVRFNVRFKIDVCATFIFIQTKPDGSLSMLCGEVVWRQVCNEDMYQYGAQLLDENGSLSKELKEQVEQIKRSQALP